METYKIKHRPSGPSPETGRRHRRRGGLRQLRGAVRARPAGSDVEVEVSTAVTGFEEVWTLVVGDFVDRASPGGMRISINDGGATPDVVTLRLLQGAAMMPQRRREGVMAESPVTYGGELVRGHARASGSTGLLDEGSFRECLPPADRVQSPHLAAVRPAGRVRRRRDRRPRQARRRGRARRRAGRASSWAAPSREVSGAKLRGPAARRARRRRRLPRAVLLLLDSGGVRLQEANAGELAVAEVMRAIAEARAAGVAVVAAGGRQVRAPSAAPG